MSGATRFPSGRLVVATLNPGKAREIALLLGTLPLALVPLASLPGEREPVVEDGATFVANALLKAHAACRATGLAAVADDSGLCVDALDGEPGVRSARFAGAGATDLRNNQFLLERLAGVPPGARAARFVCAAALVMPGGRERVTEGEVAGRILEAPLGEGGFGYDPLFYYPAFGTTFGAVPAARKNGVSHRAQAFSELGRAIEALLEAS